MAKKVKKIKQMSYSQRLDKSKKTLQEFLSDAANREMRSEYIQKQCDAGAQWNTVDKSWKSREATQPQKDLLMKISPLSIPEINAMSRGQASDLITKLLEDKKSRRQSAMRSYASESASLQNSMAALRQQEEEIRKRQKELEVQKQELEKLNREVADIKSAKREFKLSIGRRVLRNRK